MINTIKRKILDDKGFSMIELTVFLPVYLMVFLTKIIWGYPVNGNV